MAKADRPERDLGGRPPYERDERVAVRVRALVAVGLRIADIARTTGISEPTLRKYYREELEAGHIEANARVAQSLFRMATDPKKPNAAAAIFWLKCRAGWRERDPEDDPLSKRQLREALSAAADRGTEWEALLTPTARRGGPRGGPLRKQATH